jgi:hypothetical protein
VPDTGSAEVNRYLRELAEAMDERTGRLGEHAATTQPLWARQALGPVPDDPIGRVGWEHRASVVAAYRERYGYCHPGDPIGPEPAKTSPEARATWHAALHALIRVDGIDLRGCTDGGLWLRRSTYERETAWAPPHVAEELRLMRRAERDAHVNAIRAQHEAHAATDVLTAARHLYLARIWSALETKAAREAQMFAAVQETRQQWEAVTQTTRRIAIAADLELRRRHPGMPIPPLRPHPAELEGMADPVPDEGAEQTLGGTANSAPNAPPQSRHDAEAQRQRILGLSLDAAENEIPEHVMRIREHARIAQAKLDELASLPEQAVDMDSLSPGPAWPVAAQRDRDAILQPPRPEVVPSARIAERYAELANTVRPEPERG